MEPMTLGSPTNSPGGSPNMSYLPPFLLGEINSPSAPRQSMDSLSPTKGRSLAFGMSSPMLASTPDQKIYRNNSSLYQQSLYNKQNNYSTVTSPQQKNISYNDKMGGPPIEDLYDTLRSTDGSRIFQDSNFNGSLYQMSFNPSTSMNNTSQGWNKSCQDEEYWVTVFGFPPGSANLVLAVFATYGTILGMIIALIYSLRSG